MCLGETASKPWRLERQSMDGEGGDVQKEGAATGARRREVEGCHTVSGGEVRSRDKHVDQMGGSQAWPVD